MDNLKLKILCGTLLPSIIFLYWTCNSSANSKAFEKIDLESWDLLSEKFMNEKCPSYDEFKKPIEPILALQNGMTFETIDGYIQYRLSYRKIILDQLSKIDYNDVSKITIEENYQRNNWSSARIIINNISQEKKIYRIIKDENMIALNEEEINNFFEYNWENDCEVFKKFKNIYQMRIVTDFLVSGEYTIRKISLFE